MKRNLRLSTKKNRRIIRIKSEPSIDQKLDLESDLEEDFDNFNSDDLRTIYISNIPYVESKNDPQKYIEKKLENLFESFGTIKKITLTKVPKYNSKKSYSYIKTIDAYMVFEEIEAVEKSIGMNRTIFEGNHLLVDKYIEKSRISNELYVFMTNIHFRVTEEDIYQFFDEHELEAQKVRIPRDERFRSFGYAFVYFKNETDIENALKLNEEEICDRKVYISNGSITKEEREKQTKQKENIIISKIPFESNDKLVFMMNIPEIFDEIKIYEYLRRKRYKVDQVRVIRDPNTEKSTKLAYVLFQNETDAKKLIKNQNRIDFEPKVSQKRKIETSFEDDENYTKKRKYEDDE